MSSQGKRLTFAILETAAKLQLPLAWLDVEGHGTSGAECWIHHVALEVKGAGGESGECGQPRYWVSRGNDVDKVCVGAPAPLPVLVPRATTTSRHELTDEGDNYETPTEGGRRDRRPPHVSGHVPGKATRPDDRNGNANCHLLRNSQPATMVDTVTAWSGRGTIRTEQNEHRSRNGHGPGLGIDSNSSGCSSPQNNSIGR